jgi:hypothetical protein
MNRRRIGTKDHQPDSGWPVAPATSWWLESLGLAALGALTVLLVATSWRRWPDPLIDFGRELYVPWRLAQGAVLYRDADCLYGPLSPYLNAALFKCFGTGLTVIVVANLAVFAAILAVTYRLCRRAWGAVAAALAGIAFVAVFGFSQYVKVANYNYATPYAHQTTHGMLVCLLLVAALVRWLDGATLRRCFLIGLLLGLTAVLKPEFMLAGSLVTIAAGLIRWRHRGGLSARAIATGGIGALLPTLLFTAYFAAHLPWKEALVSASRGWFNLTTNLSSERMQQGFFGFDQPWKNLGDHVGAFLLAGGLIALIVGAAWLVERCGPRWLRLLVVGLLVAGLAWLACIEINWLQSGRCLFGLMLVYAFIGVAPLVRKSGRQGDLRGPATRLLMALLALALMARMVLNGRIYHYGYYQAALAWLLVPAVLIGELPGRIRVLQWGRAVVVLASLALITPGVVILANQSQEVLALKTSPVGEGADFFYAFPPRVDPTGEIVSLVSAELLKMPRDQTLLVLPEGMMINYLARQPSPVPDIYFFGVATGHGGEERIVKALQQHPPDRVVIISRDLREYGVQRYGEGPGSGQQLLQWAVANYDPAFSIGGDPLDVRQRGSIVLERKAGR